MEEVKYPRYLSTNPTGEDLLEGKSQTKISAAICQHILQIDNLPEGTKYFPKMPRIIGLEGKWGSGKSNVLNHLQYFDLIKEPHYKFFVYDAWANQEDLQRRTILEQLTSYLIDDRRLLTDKVTVRMQKADEKNEFHPVDVEVTWKEKLDLLMAKKVKNITRSVSPINTEFKYLMLTLALTPMCITLMNTLKFSSNLPWWYFVLTVVIVLLPAVLFASIIYFRKDLSFTKVLKAYQATTENKTRHQVINETEPTIHEFATWMKGISDGLKEYKLIVVFDNMDRLPADKVKKLWSAIHSIFSTDNYKNIWCIIPYDFEHLSCAFGDEAKERELLTKYFINKSFPIVFRVPEPIVIDYKQIFNQFFLQAFGNTVNEADAEIINRCYRVANTSPNIRAIISFINRMVTLTNLYENVAPVSIAIYLLKEDCLLKHPEVTEKEGDKEIVRIATTDEYILKESYLKGFEKIIRHKNSLQKEIAALVYGIEPDRAYQIPMNNSLEKILINNDSVASLSPYVDHPLFASVLTEVVHKIDTIYHENVTAKLSSVSGQMPEEARIAIQQAWDYLADQYILIKAPVQKYGIQEKNILQHVSGEKQRMVAKVFCTFFTSDEAVAGSDIFTTLLELENEGLSDSWNINDVCPPTELTPAQFVSYVQEAGPLYKQYPISADRDELNAYLIDKLSADEDLTDVIGTLQLDSSYSVGEVADKAIEEFAKEKAPYNIAVRLLNIIKLFHSKPDINPSKDYLIDIFNKAKEDEKNPANPSNEYKELYVLLALTYPGNLQGETEMTDKDCAERVLSYSTTKGLLETAIKHPGDYALQGLVTGTIFNKVIDTDSNINEGFVTIWASLINNSAYSVKSHLFDFADAWGYNKLSEEEQSCTIEQLLPSQDWVDEMLASETKIAQVLIEKAVHDVKSQSTDTICNLSNLGLKDNYWSKLLLKLLKNEKLLSPLGENLVKMVVKALQMIAQNKYTKNETIDKLLEIGFEDFSHFATEVNDISRKIFLKADTYSITASNFVILHKWLEKTGISEAGNIRHAADTVLAPIVDNVTCQQVMLDNRELYKEIIVGSYGESSVLHNKLRAIVRSDEDTDFKQFIATIIKYPEEDNKK